MIIPFATKSADKETVNCCISIRVGHPVRARGEVGFAMFSEDRLPLELFSTPIEGANVSLVRFSVVFFHSVFVLKWHLTSFLWAVILQ